MAQKIVHYDIGDIWTPQATFTVSGTPTTPTALTVRLQDAAGTESVIFGPAGSTAGLNAGSSPVALTGTGVFKLNPGTTLNLSGYWYVKFEGTAGVIATEQQQCIVDPDEFSSNAGMADWALVGLSETKDWLQQQNVDTSSDLDLVRCINDISMRFATEAGREFKPYVLGTGVVRTFDVDDQAFYQREIVVGDLSAFTQVRILDELGNLIQTPSLSDCLALPRVRRPWDPITSIRFTQNVVRLWEGLYPNVVEVTGTWGFPSVPGNVRQAVLDAVASTMDRAVESYRDDLAGPVITSGGAKVDSLPPAAMDVAISYRQELVG